MAKIDFNFNGTVSRDFFFRFFSWIILPQVPGNSNRVISNFFLNSQRYSQGKVHQKFATTFNDTGSKFAAGVNYTCMKEANGKFATGTAGVTDSGDK